MSRDSRNISPDEGGESESFLEYRILGPLVVLDDDKPVLVGARKQRQLLALMVINANRVVPTDHILEELWGDDARGKENALWVYISRLRSALGDAEALVTRDHGYSLVADPAKLDSHRFETAVEVGCALVKQDPAQASNVLAEALALWHGTALEEFQYDDFAQAEISRLEGLRMEALECRIEADLRRGLSGELVSELEALQSAHPTRERAVRHLMTALYRSGRQTDALRSFERFRVYIGEESGLEPSPELRLLQEQILLHDPRIQGPQHELGSHGPPRSEVNPFKGLRAFGEEDATGFFGRDRTVADIIQRLNDVHLIGLVGPSGSGKSSIVRAGVVPALRKGALEGSDGWLIAQMLPGAHPFAELEAALLRSSLDAPDSLSEQLNDPDAGMLRAMLRVLPRETSRLVLIIDQFEELFILGADKTVRDRFLSGLLEAADDPYGRIRIVFTLRADFYDRPLEHSGFGARMGEGIVNVVPLSPDEFEAAAQRPLDEAGVTLEPSLLAALLTDVVGQTGGLPLFQYALTELFDRRRDETLQLDTYVAMGGVHGVLSRRADDLYDAFDAGQQAAVRQLALRLVTITTGDEWGRRRVPASEILSLDIDVVALQTVIDTFTKHRLLTLDRDVVTGSPTVEVAHEALLTNWGLLREWIEDGREDLKRRDFLKAAVDEWNGADCNPDYLFTGARLTAYEQWSATSTMQLSVAERAFIDAGGDHRDRTESLSVVADKHAGRSKRRRWLALVVAILVLAGLSTAIFLVARSPRPTSVVAYGPVSFSDNVTALAETGFGRAERELNVEVEHVGRQVSGDPEGDYRALGELGTDIVILDNDDDTLPWIEAVIADYPATAFVLVTPFSGEALTGASTIHIADEQLGFLAGAAAAVATETGVIGYLGGIQWGALETWRAGYEAGAMAVDPEIEILATYASSNYSDGFESPEYVRTVALDLYQRGADVVLAASGTASLGAIEAARDHSEESASRVFAIPVDSDWSVTVGDDLQPYLLTSAVKRFDSVVFEVIKQHTEDDLAPGEQTLTLSSGKFGLAPSVHLTPAQLDVIDDLTNEVIEGNIAVPRIPSGELIPPLGFPVSGEITVTWDGESCSSSSVGDAWEAGTSARIEFVNLTSEYSTLWVTAWWPELSLPGAATSSMTGYLPLASGTHELSCHVGSWNGPSFQAPEITAS